MDPFVVLFVVLALVGSVVAIAKTVHKQRSRSTSRPGQAVAGARSERAVPIGDDSQLELEIAALESKMVETERVCWKPVTVAGDSAPTESKFGGVPYLESDEEWPVCGNCSQPVQLFLQLSSGTTPAALPFSGLLQFFYCTNTQLECEVASEAWAPRARSTILRVVRPEGEPRNVSVLPPSASFAPRTISSWRELRDYPHYEDAIALGIDVPDDLIHDIVERFQPEEGDKLLGWPAWVQGAEYPTCAQCRARMRYLFQIASEDNIPYMFGDVGTGHICICPNHPEELTFGWACS